MFMGLTVVEAKVLPNGMVTISCHQEKYDEPSIDVPHAVSVRINC